MGLSRRLRRNCFRKAMRFYLDGLAILLQQHSCGMKNVHFICRASIDLRFIGFSFTKIFSVIKLIENDRRAVGLSRQKRAEEDCWLAVLINI